MKIFTILYLCLQTCVLGLTQEEKISFMLKNNPELQKLDDELNQTYKMLKDVLSPEEQKILLEKQLLWLKERNEKLDDATFVKELYSSKINDFYRQFDNLLPSLIFLEEESVDYGKLQKNLENCAFPICKTYKAFVEYELSKREKADEEKAQEFLNSLKIDWFSYPSFLELFSSNYFLKKGRFTTWDRIPLWLVFKYPKVLESNMNSYGYNWTVNVAAKKSIYSLNSFKKMQEILNSMEGNFNIGPVLGHWYAVGSRRYIDKISFTPGLANKYSNETIFENLAPLEDWGMQGIWNSIVYKEFKKVFAETVNDTKTYYQENYGFRRYVDDAERLLSNYVHKRFYHPKFTETKAFKAVNSYNVSFFKSVKTLESVTKDFVREDWNQFLHMAILSDFSLDFITWIIDKGSDVNHSFMCETPLMNAANKKDVLELLLKKGSKVDAKTPYGKTALFYAIQFGDLETVQILLDHKASVSDSYSKLGNDYFVTDEGHQLLFYAEKLEGFTPLVYALRYGTQKIIDLLLSKGAKLGSASRENIKSWVLNNSTIEPKDLEKQMSMME